MKRFTKVQSSDNKIKKVFEQDGQTDVESSVYIKQSDIIAAGVTSSVSTDVNTDVQLPSLLFSKFFESREMAHIYHLQVNGDVGSYAAHKALNSYYDDVLDHIDDLVEMYQGQYELVGEYETIDTKSTSSKDKVEYFNELASFIKENRYKCLSKDDTHLQNVVDEIVSLIYRLLYKLRYNK